MSETRVGMGEYLSAKPPEILSTYLGSCIGIIVVGANKCSLAHCVLPTRRTAEDDKINPRYVDEGMELILADYKNEDKKKLRFYLYGGASIVGSSVNVGEENIKAIEAIIKSMGLRVYERDLGGAKSRFITVDCRTQEVECQKIDNLGYMNG